MMDAKTDHGLLWWLEGGEVMTRASNLDQAKKMIWHDHGEPGEPGQPLPAFNTAAAIHPLDTLTAFDIEVIGSKIHEFLSEQLHQHVGGEDEAIELSQTQQEEMARLIMNFYRTNGRVRVWDVSPDVTNHPSAGESPNTEDI
jgi:hypothetical protein